VSGAMRQGLPFELQLIAMRANARRGLENSFRAQPHMNIVMVLRGLEISRSAI
jgi:hypothetical protein